jgi:hypothetical protein
MNIFKKFAEESFERMLKVFSGIANWAETAKNLKVSVKIQNLVETKSPVRKLTILAENTWVDLFDDKKRCRMEGIPVNVAPDLLISITETDGNLEIKVESEYLVAQEKSEVAEVFEDFIETANKILDEVFGRERKSLTINGSLATASKTKQILELSEFFEEKLERAFFAVLTKKFAVQAKKKS